MRNRVENIASHRIFSGWIPGCEAMRYPQMRRCGLQACLTGKDLTYLEKLLCAEHSAGCFACFYLFDLMRALWHRYYGLRQTFLGFEAQRWCDLTKASKLSPDGNLCACVLPSLPHCSLSTQLCQGWEGSSTLPSTTALNGGFPMVSPKFGAATTSQYNCTVWI